MWNSLVSFVLNIVVAASCDSMPHLVPCHFPDLHFWSEGRQILQNLKWMQSCRASGWRFFLVSNNCRNVYQTEHKPLNRTLTRIWLPFLSADQLCDLRTRPVHVASRTAIYRFSTITDDATALRWSQVDRSTRVRYFTLCVVWLD